MASYKIHGWSKAPDQFLTGGLPMYTVTVTNVDLTVMTPADADDGEQHNVALDKLVELISTRAQPVVIGTVGQHSFRFAVEHDDAFGGTDSSDNETLAGFTAKVQAGLQAALDDDTVTVAIAAFVF